MNRKIEIRITESRPPTRDRGQERAYQALHLCDIDGDDRTTAVLLESLRIGESPDDDNVVPGE